MQTGSSGTLIGWKSGQTTYVPLWHRMEGAWLWTLGYIVTMEAVCVTEEMTRHVMCDFHHVRCFVYILVWIRIWICGSMPLTYGSGSCFFFVIDIQDANKKLI